MAETTGVAAGNCFGPSLYINCQTVESVADQGFAQLRPKFGVRPHIAHGNLIKLVTRRLKLRNERLELKL